VPDARSLVRLVTLAGFLVLVALGLWLLDAEWPVIIGVMIGAWALAAVVEWAAWRHERLGGALVRRQTVVVEPEAVEPTVGPPEPPPVAADEQEAQSFSPKTEPLTAILNQPPATEEAPAEPGPAAPIPAPVRAPRDEPTRPPLRPVPPPAPQPPPRPATPPAARARDDPGVVDLRRRATAQARRWNLWDLERLARDELQREPERFRELSYLFVHLRQFASPDGSLPTEFDPLVRESLGDLLEQRG
jgi:hypothetical protein